jgi:hypothetical protein
MNNDRPNEGPQQNGQTNRPSTRVPEAHERGELLARQFPSWDLLPQTTLLNRRRRIDPK